MTKEERIDDVATKYAKMFQMQYDLNLATCGDEWVGDVCKSTGKPINWNLAILDECSELLGSTDWKWWKSGKTDDLNIGLELADVLHFKLSRIMSEYGGLLDPSDVDTYAQVVTELGDLLEINEYNIVDYLQDVLDNENNMIQIMTGYWILARNMGYSFDDLYHIYILKNRLNHFRQENGYTDGTYVKDWIYNGVVEEDNHILMKIFSEYDNGNEQDMDDAMLEFGELYRKVNDV